MTHSLDDALVEKASRAFLETARAVGEVENGVRDKRPYETLDPVERLQLESCVRAALEAAGELREEIEELKKQRLMILAAVYGVAPKFVAKICDVSLDRSGALLGQVCELARAAINPRQNEEEGDNG